MYTRIKKYIKDGKKAEVKGFVMPFTLLICSIMILITTSVSAILLKQIYFSQLARQSQIAYYAADTAMQCAITVDETYHSGVYGIFPYDSSDSGNPGAADEQILDAFDATTGNKPSSYEDIKCAQSFIFKNENNDPTKYEHEAITYLGLDGYTSRFNMQMDVGDGTFRCAKVIVKKTTAWRQIIVSGYSSCSKGSNTIERAIVNETEY